MFTLIRPSGRTRALLSLTIVSAMMASLLISPSSALNRTAPPSHGEGMSATGGTGQTPPAAASAESLAAVRERARAAYGAMEMSFVENRGQTDEEVKFLARGGVFPNKSHFCFIENDKVRESIRV